MGRVGDGSLLASSADILLIPTGYDHVSGQVTSLGPAPTVVQIRPKLVGLVRRESHVLCLIEQGCCEMLLVVFDDIVSRR